MWPFTKKQQNKKPIGAGRRTYAAALVDRLSASWVTTSQSIDWDLRRALPVLRARSRDLTQNNDYAKKFLQMCSTHVVGPTGFSLQVRVPENDARGNARTDQVASTAIEKAFYRWAKRGNCDVTGRLSFFDICNLYIKAVARDGEVLIRKVYGGPSPFGFQLQILDIERLDVNKNEILNNGSVIKMGVEIDRYGKPVAYHLRTAHPGDNPWYTDQGSIYERVPADLIYHHFIADRPEQNRGVPWLHSAMTRLNNLGGYEQAAVVAARLGASKMGFFTTPDGDAQALASEQDAAGNFISESTPGEFQVLPDGYDFKPFDPDYPHAMYAEFVKSSLRGVASGLGVAYNTLSNDLEGVNFSSIRTGVLEERDNWMVIQNWMIEQFLDDVFENWLRFALLNRQIILPNGSALPVAKFDKFNAATWQGRRWQWVDPRADVESNIMAIQNGLKSRADVIAEQGKDIDDVFAQLAEEQQEISALGLVLGQPQQQAQADNNQNGANNGQQSSNV